MFMKWYLQYAAKYNSDFLIFYFPSIKSIHLNPTKLKAKSSISTENQLLH